MKLGDDVLVRIIEIVRVGIVDGVDISELLRGIDLLVDGSGKLALATSLKFNETD